MEPTLITGDQYKDARGFLFYNNGFNATDVKRIYCIENSSLEIKRQWQGHKVEQRWFTAMVGSFKIRLIKINNWKSPDKLLNSLIFVLKSENLEILHIPAGYVSSIQALEPQAKLLVMADYLFNEINDDFKFEPDYFIEVQ